MQLRIRSGSGKLTRRYMWLVLALLFLLLIIIVLLWQYWPRKEVLPDVQFDMPGCPAQSSDLYKTGANAADTLQEKAEQLLSDGQIWYEWYQQAGPLRQPPARRSDTAFLTDQLLYGQLLLEQQSHRAFSDWWAAFSAAWLLRNDTLQMPVSADSEWLASQQQQVLQLLGQSITIWPDAQRLADLYAMSDQLLNLYDGKLPLGLPVAVPSPLPAPDPAASPTPRPSATPTPDPDVPTLSVIRLSDLDLLALSDLVQIDERWQPLRDDALRVVQNGYLSDDLPLFALAWSEAEDQYILFSGDQPHVDLALSLRVMLQLAEVDQLPDRCLSWLKDQLYNRGALFSEYHTVQGIPATEVEQPLIYALTARIALTADDPVLYELAVDRLLWFRATSMTSDVRFAIFREESDDLIRVWAVDNLLALLVLPLKS